VNQGVQGSPEALGPKTDSSGICTTICICKMQIEATLFVLQQSLRHHLHFAVGLRIRRILGESDAFSLLSSTCTTPTVLSPSDQPPSRCPSSRSDAAIAAPEGVEEGMAESPSGDIRGRRVEVDGGQAQGEEVARISPVTVLFLLAPGGVELQRSLQAARAGEPCPRGRPPIPAGGIAEEGRGQPRRERRGRPRRKPRMPLMCVLGEARLRAALTAPSPRKAGRPAAPLARRSQPPKQDARGDSHAAGVLCWWRYCFLLSPCCRQGVCRCRSSKPLESV
jgi:hypothetical protein